MITSDILDYLDFPYQIEELIDPDPIDPIDMIEIPDHIWQWLDRTCIDE